MNERYNFREIEKKWQKYWADNNTFKMEEKPDMHLLLNVMVLRVKNLGSWMLWDGLRHRL